MIHTIRTRKRILESSYLHNTPFYRSSPCKNLSRMHLHDVHLQRRRFELGKNPLELLHLSREQVLDLVGDIDLGNVLLVHGLALLDDISVVGGPTAVPCKDLVRCQQ